MTNRPSRGGDWDDDVDRRLRALETAPRMPFTSQKGGSFFLISPTTDRPMEVFGEFSNGLGGMFFGIATYDGDGHSMVMTRDDTKGLVKPDIPIPFHVPSPGVAVTSGSFVDVFESQSRAIYHDSVIVGLPVVTDATGTGEIKIVDVAGSGATTATLTVPINTAKVALFQWKHGVALGDDSLTENPFFQIQARRTSGGGSFSLFPPPLASLTSSVLLPAPATNGNPQLL